MAERIYRYRGFDVRIDVRPLQGVDDTGHTIVAGYRCHVRLAGKADQSDLPPLALLDRGARLFCDEQDAVIAGCRAGEAVVDATFASTASPTVKPLALCA